MEHLVIALFICIVILLVCRQITPWYFKPDEIWRKQTMKMLSVLCAMILLSGCGGMYTWTLDEIRAKPAEQIEIKKDAFCVYTTLHRTLITNYGESPTHLVFLKWDAYWDTTKRRGEIFATEQGPYGEYPLHFTIYAAPEKTIIEKRTSLYAGTDWTWSEMIAKILRKTDYSECPAL